MVGSIQPFVGVFGSFLAGPLWDAGYGKALIAGGTLTTSFAYFMVSISTRVWEVALAQGVLAGLGSSLSFTVAVSVIPQYFTTHKASANGVAAAGSGLGEDIFRSQRARTYTKSGKAESSTPLLSDSFCNNCRSDGPFEFWLSSSWQQTRFLWSLSAYGSSRR